MKVKYLDKTCLSIVSYARPESCLKVLKSFSKYNGAGLQKFVFVDPTQYQAYRQVLRGQGIEKLLLVKLPLSHQGVGYARWFAFEILKSFYEFQLCFDDDTVLRSDWQPLVKYLLDNRNCGWAAGWLPIYDFWLKGKDCNNLHGQGGQAFCLRTKAVDEVGGWNKKLKVFEDCDLWIRLNLAFYRRAAISDVKICSIISRLQSGGMVSIMAKIKKTHGEITAAARKEIARTYQPINFIHYRKDGQQMIANFKKVKEMALNKEIEVIAMPERLDLANPTPHIAELLRIFAAIAKRS